MTRTPTDRRRTRAGCPPAPFPAVVNGSFVATLVGHPFDAAIRQAAAAGHACCGPINRRVTHRLP